MKATIQLEHKDITVNLKQPIDISLRLSAEENNPTAWYMDAPKYNP